MKRQLSFRPYLSADRDACLAIFDANTPAFFAPGERSDYSDFLDNDSDGYEVCDVEGQVVGAFGLWGTSKARTTLCWIFLDPGLQRAGVGTAIMQRVISKSRASQSRVISIATSQKAAPFFAKFGAVTKSTTENGWGVGLDRVDMELNL